MHVQVAVDRCIGSGNCALTAPEIFDQNDDDGTVVLLDADPPAERHAAVREAADRCPASVISLTGIGPPPE